MNIIEHTIQTLRQQPRAIQWAVLAALGFVLFMIWDMGIAPMTEKWKNEADSLQAKVQQISNSAELVQQFDSINAKISGIGQVEMPAGELQGRQATLKVINDVLKNYSVSQERFGINEGRRLPKNTLSNIAKTKRLESLKVDLDFISTPEVAIEIIALFESSPEIEFVRTVRLTKAPSKKVKVKLTLETWVLGS